MTGRDQRFLVLIPVIQMDGRWIRSMRGEKSPVDPYLPYGWFNDQERTLEDYPRIASLSSGKESVLVEWACRSIEFAFGCGVDVCSVIPVRSGNGALDRLTLDGYFQEPSIHSLERVIEYGTGLQKGLVFADLWDLERFSRCDNCFAFRKERLNQINLTQEQMRPVECSC